jgi:energy-converting hydrogenase B subunit Q
MSALDFGNVPVSIGNSLRQLSALRDNRRTNRLAMTEKIGVVIEADPGPGILYQLTGVIARHGANITSVDIIEERQTYFEIDVPNASELLGDLEQLPIVHRVSQVKTFQAVFGKRIVIIGGGAQVGQVAIGAISEADRHNIRGEHISVDTIPLVGEQALADAVRACARLRRVKALVLAGSLMGGDIQRAVLEVRAQGMLVVSLNMAGSVPEAADLVVSDPLQAGVMTVMAVAETAKFNIARLKQRVF